MPPRSPTAPLDLPIISEKERSAASTASESEGTETSAADEPKAEVSAKAEELARGLRSKKVAQRVAAAAALGEMGPEARGTEDALCESLLDSSPKVVEVAGNALEKVRPDLQKPLITLLVDPQPANVQQALAALADLGPKGKAATPVILAYLRKMALSNQPNAELCSKGVSTLGKISADDPNTVRLLIGLANSPGSDPLVRGAVVQTLGEIGASRIPLRKQILPILTASLYDVPPVCAAAVEALGLFGPDAKRAVPALRKLKFHPDLKVREAAAVALQKIER